MFPGPVGPVELCFCFYQPKAIFGNFSWPGASGSLLVSSPDMLNIKVIFISITGPDDYGQGKLPAQMDQNINKSILVASTYLLVSHQAAEFFDR